MIALVETCHKQQLGPYEIHWRAISVDIDFLRSTPQLHTKTIYFVCNLCQMGHSITSAIAGWHIIQIQPYPPTSFCYCTMNFKWTLLPIFYNFPQQKKIDYCGSKKGDWVCLFVPAVLLFWLKYDATDHHQSELILCTQSQCQAFHFQDWWTVICHRLSMPNSSNHYHHLNFVELD